MNINIADLDWSHLTVANVFETITQISFAIGMILTYLQSRKATAQGKENSEHISKNTAATNEIAKNVNGKLEKLNRHYIDAVVDKNIARQILADNIKTVKVVDEARAEQREHDANET